MLHIYDLLFQTDVRRSEVMSLSLYLVHEKKLLQQIYLLNI